MTSEDYISEVRSLMRDTWGCVFSDGTNAYRRMVNLVLEARARELEGCLPFVGDLDYSFLRGRVRDLRRARMNLCEISVENTSLPLRGL